MTKFSRLGKNTREEKSLSQCGSEGDTEGGREREEKRDNQTLGHNFPPTAVFLQQVGIKT